VPGPCKPPFLEVNLTGHFTSYETRTNHELATSITENIDTSSATGKLTFHIFGALAEFERNLIKERTIAGLAAARARGKSGGRPKRSPKSSKVTLANKLYADKANTINDICRILNISRATLYRYIKE
jgi:DNA invertase Pin-like site-specific DNA recombinase